jgi:hypothetical protein
LPFHFEDRHEAMKVLLAQHALKPEPRKGLAPVVALVSATMSHGERAVLQDKPTSPHQRTTSRDGPRTCTASESRKLIARLFVPIAHEVASSFRPPVAVVRPAESPLISPETERLLKGLSARPALREFGTHVPFANELLALGRDHGLGVEQVLGALDELNHAVLGLDSLPRQARTNALYVAAMQVFAGLDERVGSGEHDETNDSQNVAAGTEGAGLVENNLIANAAGLGCATAKRAGADGAGADDGGKAGCDTGLGAASWGGAGGLSERTDVVATDCHCGAHVGGFVGGAGGVGEGAAGERIAVVVVGTDNIGACA